MKTLLSRIIIFFLLTSSITVAQDTSLIDNKNYSSNLQEVINKLKEGNKITQNEILNAIPRNKNQYLIFYSHTEKDKESNTAFYKLSNLILEGAINENYQIFKSFLLLSEFVDGDFAEVYYVDIKSLIKNKRHLFCELYQELPKEKVKRLKIFYEEFCK